MSSQLLSTVLLFLNAGVLIYMIIRTVSLISSKNLNMMLIFFLFGTVSFLVSEIYWIAFDLLRPGVRMPFAANEIGESAGLLLYASAVLVVCPHAFQRARKEVLFGAAFSLVSIILWIIWSGEWVQDILGGVVYGYFLCAVVGAMKLEEVLSDKEWRALACTAFLLEAAELLSIILPGKWASGMEKLGYLIMLVYTAALFMKAYHMFRISEEPGKLFIFMFGVLIWIISCIYMSDGYFYCLLQFAESAASLFLIEAVCRKEASP